MSRNTFKVSRAEAALAKVKNSLRGMKKDSSPAAVVHEEDLIRWERHFEDELTNRKAILARRISAREEKKKNPATKEQQKLAFSGKMKNGMLLGSK